MRECGLLQRTRPAQCSCKPPPSVSQKSLPDAPRTFQGETSRHPEEGEARPPSTEGAGRHAASVTGNASGCEGRDAMPGCYRVLSGGPWPGRSNRKNKVAAIRNEHLSFQTPGCAPWKPSGFTSGPPPQPAQEESKGPGPLVAGLIPGQEHRAQLARWIPGPS